MDNDLKNQTIEEVIQSLNGWMRKYASGMVVPTDQFYDDLLQEARIHLWQTLEKTDEVNKAYLIKAIKWHMISIIRRRATKQQRQVNVDYDTLNFDYLLAAPDKVDHVAFLYHQEELFDTLNSFRPQLREYLIRRFWYGQHDAQIAREMGVYPSRVSRWWSNQIQPKLAVALAHLQEE